MLTLSDIFVFNFYTYKWILLLKLISDLDHNLYDEHIV
jgi:hypothetical protein